MNLISVLHKDIIKPHTPTIETCKKESVAGPFLNVEILAENCGGDCEVKGLLLTIMVPNSWPNWLGLPENIPITKTSSVIVKVPYKINVSVVNQPGLYKPTPGGVTSSCITTGRFEGTFAPRSGVLTTIPCAEHVVIKAVSNAATVNFIVVVSSGDSISS